MKKAAIISVFAGILLFSSAIEVYASLTNKELMGVLQSLIHKDLSYDSGTLIDYIISRINNPVPAILKSSKAEEVLLKANYQSDKSELESNTEENKIVIAFIIFGLGLSVFILILVIRLKRQKQKITLSKERLGQSRRNAEKAMYTKSVFLSNMSHEIRTPLNALSGFSSLLTEEGLDNETRLQCTEIIQQNSELLLKLINDVIDLSSLEFGKLQFHLNKYDAITICRNVVDTVGKVKQTQAELHFVTPLEKLYIETDASRLQQVLINLLINATKFTTEGSITLQLEKASEDTALFSITDTGCGIPKEKQPYIFQRYEKLNENAQGSGLGLSICQLIIEHVGGSIWIDPDYTEGVRFLFTHPIRQTNNRNERRIEHD